MAARTVTQDRLKEALNYDPETGVFTWAEPGRGKRIGRTTGTVNDEGYVVMTIDQRQYRANRLAWLYVYGEWPEGIVDHENRDRADNRISNLRDATFRQNSHNHGLYSDNRSGISGVCWVKKSSRWHVYFGREYQGCFTDFFEACCARKSAENKFWLHS